MEWTQIAAWVVWAWVAINTVVAIIESLGIYFDSRSSTPNNDEVKTMALIAAACALNAILGLMLIQTSGLTV